jgi:hypothetical protein
MIEFAGRALLARGALAQRAAGAAKALIEFTKLAALAQNAAFVAFWHAADAAADALGWAIGPPPPSGKAH